MAKNLMFQGTGSSVGKSLITAAFCRIYANKGFKVAPFKSQNMALNSYITKKGLEMGRAQVVQAEAARIEPSALMNPILLKPSTDKKCQVILEGKVYKNMSAMDYHCFKPKLKEKVTEIYNKLSDEFDIVLLEGAGSPAEINLKEHDLVNMGMAKMADSPVILIGDIDRGGVFASIYGTIMLMDEEERRRIKGVIINKFRGDVKILEPGIKMLEDLINIPVVGVVPYCHLEIEEEDSVAERFKRKNKKAQIEVAVLYLPHVSNFTDFNVFDTQEDVNLRYVMRGESIGDVDMLIIPGSKNTIEDLKYVRDAGLEREIIHLHRNNKIIFGICGGYQMLGKTIKDPHYTESSIPEINGIGLLDTQTIFETEKTTTQVKAKIVADVDYMKNMDIKGYEIHMGKTTLNDEAKVFSHIIDKLGEKVVIEDGAINNKGNVMGTYIHGVFDNIKFTRSILNKIREDKGLNELHSSVESFDEFKDKEYDKLAQLVLENVDMPKIDKILNGEL